MLRKPGPSSALPAALRADRHAAQSQPEILRQRHQKRGRIRPDKRNRDHQRIVLRAEAGNLDKPRKAVLIGARTGALRAALPSRAGVTQTAELADGRKRIRDIAPALFTKRAGEIAEHPPLRSGSPQPRIMQRSVGDRVGVHFVRISLPARVIRRV